VLTKDQTKARLLERFPPGRCCSVWTRWSDGNLGVCFKRRNGGAFVRLDPIHPTNAADRKKLDQIIDYLLEH